MLPGQPLRLSEHIFDPVLAVHASLVEPLLHQVTAVYDAMLPRHPLRFSEIPRRRVLDEAVVARSCEVQRGRGLASLERVRLLRH